MIVYILVVLVVILVGLGLYLWWRLCLKSAYALLATLTAESMIVRNLHPDSRADFVVTKATEAAQSTSILVRPLVMWYIRSRGVAVATGIVRYIVYDLQADERITLNP